MGIRRALATATIERYIAMVGNFATLAVVSRWLTPTEIGLAILANTIAVTVMCLREFVSADFIVQRHDLTQTEARTSLTLVYISSLALGLLLVLTAGWFGDHYGSRDLPTLLLLSTACLVIEGVSSPVVATLRRQMAFERIAVVNSIGMAVFASTAVTLAILGYGPLSLVLNWLASSSLTAVIYLVWAPDRKIFKPSLLAARAVASFGLYNGLNTLLFRAYDSLPYLFLGRVLPVSSLALYNRSVNLVQLPDKVFLGGISGVMLSAMSKEVRSGRDLSRHYLAGLELITALQTPALIVLAILAHPIILVVLGPQWTQAAPLVSIMATAMLASFSTELNNPVLLALGQMRWFVIRSFLTWPIGALALAGAASFGLHATALAWLFIMPWYALVSLSIVKRHVGLRWGEIGLVLRKAAYLGVWTGAGPLAVVALHPQHFELPVSAGLFAGALAAAGWAVGLWVTSHVLLNEIRLTGASIAAAASRRIKARAAIKDPV